MKIIFLIVYLIIFILLLFSFLSGNQDIPIVASLIAAWVAFFEKIIDFLQGIVDKTKYTVKDYQDHTLPYNQTVQKPTVVKTRATKIWERILFTAIMLVLFRIGILLPIPGINTRMLSTYFLSQTNSINPIVDYLNLFTGGAFSNFSVFMLGFFPYSFMLSIMQFFFIVFPRLKKLSQEEEGNRKIQAYTKLGTVILSFIMSFIVTWYIQSISRSIDNLIIIHTIPITWIIMVTITGGTIFLMWISGQITKRGIAYGNTVLIFAGIVARIPKAIWELKSRVQYRQFSMDFAIVIVVFIMFMTIISIVVFVKGTRMIPVNYAKRIVNGKLYGTQNTYLPFILNPGGIYPIISATLFLPISIIICGKVSWFAKVSQFLSPQGILYNVLYVLLLIYYLKGYILVYLKPIEIAKQIRENDGSIPGIRSERIEEYLSKILNRIMFPGAIYLAFITIIPSIIIQWLFNFSTSPFYILGGGSLYMMVGLCLDLYVSVKRE